MFQSIRKHSRIVMVLLFLLIIPSFIFFGIDGYNRASQKSAVVARVDGQDIHQDEWDAAHKAESDRVRAQMPQIDPKLLDSPAARYATLERLVRERVLLAAAHSERLVTSDAQLARSLQEIPAIAALRKPDGSLDADGYRALVGSQGLTPEGFEARMRQDLSVRQVMGGIADSAFVAPAQAKAALDALHGRRAIQVAHFSPAAFAAQVNPGDADIEAYYTSHAANFQVPEQASVEYLVLDLAAVKSGLSVSEDELRTYYKENLERFAGKEERRVSHILVAATKDAPAAEREKAKARAEELLAQVRKAPQTFADVARKNSQDPGSAPQGGDLNFFARGAMVKSFEDTAFALKKGEISDVVATDFGYHIIEVTDIKTPHQPSFEELRAKLEDEWRTQHASAKFAEVAETFSNAVYEQADSLQPAADKLKLQIRTAQGVTREPSAGATGPLASPRFLEALFSADSLQQKRNTEAIEIGPSQLAAGRIVQYAAAHARPLAEVRDQVRQALVATRATELARKDGEAKLAAWKAAPASAAMPVAVKTVSRDDLQQEPRAVVDAALRAPASALPAFVGVDLGSQGYAVVKVVRLEPPAALAADAAQQQSQQLARAATSAEALAYYEWLKTRAKTQLRVDKPAAATPAPRE
ncbi:SurA N-terminal domain-containing protein [Ramlibacter sp. H39-3-26]|uniref:SurA N-terminal domain-containing protein n=1 Tax=Curvibacter soli TaxID=3031331 RepID=UPI0023DB1E62|nr:SurA N-terminal domain-containing protein [Ramlibacter sp. H39-3-26]MDF1485272.1 SurA N-terminal domain-containing protein [Ramlibacter sp. H39-3-26]